ncbi:UDP-N-acetylglucosamine--N-acetylmuramyl-(pentapeptide) pyrophosphoryl-undecaprenol N-acetylglucosamine transferase [Streptomonospora litoralis]|nr:UDP-N-acetylglucosamine--N-acetylmuramyl-(pentapeptide) pyrophosphoryl-undecaprenol N-acetylglucosamine transferase [Streptomonospora litoralis]
MNSTSWDEQADTMVAGGQLDRYFRPVWDALEAMGVPYSVGRQPARDAVNVYPNNRSAYAPGSQRNDRESVGVSHGLADKGYRQQYRFFRHVLLPGPGFAEVLRRTRFPERKLHILGYPKLDPLLNHQVAGPERDDRIRVVYAPTHGGGSERWPEGNRAAPGAGATSWWHRDEVTALLDEDAFDVVTAPHPRHSPGCRATFEEYAGADVVIADGGSTIYEAWVLGIPVVLPAWLTRARNETRDSGRTLEARVYKRGLGYQADAPGELADLVRRAAGEGMRPAETEFAETIVPTELRGAGGQVWAEFLAHLEDRSRPAPSRRVPPQPRTRAATAGRR